MMCCLNKRVMIGLALVALGMFAFSPRLLGAAAPVLLLAVCPLSMLLTMRGMRRQGGGPSACTTTPAPGSRATDPEVAELEEEVDRLKAELRLRRDGRQV